MSIIIINSRNPELKFKFCSVFSANNPTVNDASGVTMLSVRRCGDDFWSWAEQQQQRATCFFSPHFFQLMEIVSGYVCNHGSLRVGNETLRPLGVAMGNAVSVTRV